MPKENMRDKLEGNILDLSMNSLEIVPVKEIAGIPKGTHLDLSCNLLKELPIEFCSLTYLVKIDLSKNGLTSLPINIGNLQKLQHLDLFSNQIQSLPVSFCHLKNLKWLDLKDNPLMEPLRSVAGDCLDEIQCKKCAREVVALMKTVLSEQDRQKQRILKEQKEAELLQKAEEEKERQRKKEEKIREKERKRKEYQAKRSAENERGTIESQERQDIHADARHTNGLKTEKHTPKERGGLSCCGVVLSMLVGLLAVFVGLFVYCQYQTKDQFCRDSQRNVQHVYHTVEGHVMNYYKIAHEKFEDLFMK